MIGRGVRTSAATAAQRGNAVLEFALVAPLLFMLFFGIFEMGRALYVQQALIFSAQAGARLAAVEGASVDEVRTRVETVLGPIPTSAITVTGPDEERLISVAVESEFTVLNGSALLGPFAGTLRLRGESCMLAEN